jgi:hypothetical protein
MESSTPESRKFTPEEVRAVREQHKGEVLSNKQVIALLSDPGNLDLHKVVQWLGYGIEKKDAPINRFADILKVDYSSLSHEERKRLLKGSSRFVILGERQTFRFHGTRYNDLLDRHFESVDVVMLGHRQNEQRVVTNIGELLSEALNFCGGDVNEARHLLKYEEMHRVPTRSEMRKHALAEFFDEFPDSPHAQRVDPYVKANPQIKELAFLLAVDTGDFAPENSSFFHLLTRIYDRVDGRIKARIMDYVASVVLARGVSSRIMRDANYFVSSNLELYQTVKVRLPSSPFVRAYEKARQAINLLNLLERTKGGRIEAEGLIEILEKNPVLIADVSREELELALKSTKDHKTAMKLERLIREKGKISPA